MQYALAEKLGKTLQEIQEISVHEFQRWVTYPEIAQEKQSEGKLKSTIYINSNRQD